MIVKVNVKPVLGTILCGRGRALIEFNRLGSAERVKIETEAYQRLFMSELLGSFSSWERATHGKTDKKNPEAESDNRMESEVLQNVINLKSKDKTAVTVHEKANVKRMVQIGTKFESVPVAETVEKKVKKPNATAQVTFYFDSKKSVLIVEAQDVFVREPDMKEQYTKSLEKALKTAGTNMEKKFNLPRLVKSFFDTLHVHSLCHISGTEALTMMRIFSNARVVYPLFAKLDYVKQIDILDKGYRNARSISAGSRDIHAFAKGTFEAMCEEKGLIDTMYKHDFVTNKMMYYYKVGEKRRNRVNPENPSQIWEKDSLIFVDYVYGKNRIRTSLLAFDLWDLLAKGGRNESLATV